MEQLKDNFNRQVILQAVEPDGKNITLNLKSELKPPVSLETLNNSHEEWERMTGEKIIVVDSSLARKMLGTKEDPNAEMRDLLDNVPYSKWTDANKQTVRESFIESYKQLHGDKYADIVSNISLEQLMTAAYQANDILQLSEGSRSNGVAASASRLNLDNSVGGKNYAIVVAVADTKDITAEKFFPSAFKYGGPDVQVPRNPEHIRAIMLAHELGHVVQKRMVDEMKAQGLSDFEIDTLQEVDTDVQVRRVLKDIIPEQKIDAMNSAQNLANFHGLYRSQIINEDTNYFVATHYSFAMSSEILEGGEVVGTPSDTLSSGRGLVRGIARQVRMPQNEATADIVGKTGHIGYGEMRTALEKMLEDPDRDWIGDQKDVAQRMVKEIDTLGVSAIPLEGKIQEHVAAYKEWLAPKDVHVSDYLTEKVNDGSGVTTLNQDGKTNYIFTDLDQKVTSILQVANDSDHGKVLDSSQLSAKHIETDTQITKFSSISAQSEKLFDTNKQSQDATPSTAQPNQVFTSGTYGM